MAFYRSEVPNNLGTAIALWNQFAGPQSKLNDLALRKGEQDIQLNQNQDQRAQEMHGPNLETAKLLASQHANELSKSDLDKATREGSIESINQAPVSLWKPTASMTPAELDDWKQLHYSNGVTDLGGAAGAWNATMAKATGQALPLRGQMPVTAQLDPSGGVSVESTIKSMANPGELDDVFGVPKVTPPGSNPTPAAGGFNPSPAPNGLSRPTAPGVTPPLIDLSAPGSRSVAPPTARTPATLPDVTTLTLLSPGTRAALKEGQDLHSSMLGEEEKKLQMQKAAEDVAYGIPEERKSHREFSQNAAALSHRLDEYSNIVKNYGNDEYFVRNPAAVAKLKSLPLDISDNWTKVTNPGGVLREGLVKLGKTEQIPAGIFTRSSVTGAAIDQTKRVLADYVRQYENLPMTKLPVEGLTPEVRQLVGPTKFTDPTGAGVRTDAGFKAGQLPLVKPASDVIPPARIPPHGVSITPTVIGPDGQATVGNTGSRSGFYNSQQEFEQNAQPNETANVYLPRGPKGPGFYQMKNAK